MKRTEITFKRGQNSCWLLPLRLIIILSVTPTLETGRPPPVSLTRAHTHTTLDRELSDSLHGLESLSVVVTLLTHLCVSSLQRNADTNVLPRVIRVLAAVVQLPVGEMGSAPRRTGGLGVASD